MTTLEPFTAGDWVQYEATAKVKGVLMGTGTRMGLVAEVKGKTVRIITNGPKPSLTRLRADDISAVDRPATIKECTERLSDCVRYGCPSNVRTALRDVKIALRTRRAEGTL